MPITEYLSQIVVLLADLSNFETQLFSKQKLQYWEYNLIVFLFCSAQATGGVTNETHGPRTKAVTEEPTNNERPNMAAPPIAPETVELAGLSRAPHAPALTFDSQEYREFVADSDLSESQQQELLAALWEIIVGFVDLGFNLHPIQHAIKDAKTLEPDSPGVVDLENISDSKQTAIAERHEERLAERNDS